MASLEGIEAELRAVRLEIQALAESARSHLEARALKLPQAAKLLGVGLTKLKAMVRSQEILTVEIGSTRMVPMSEVERLVTPKAHAAKSARTPGKHWTPAPKRQTTRKAR